jgi:hypothetical protein
MSESNKEIPPFQHKPKKSKNYRERVLSGEQKQWKRKRTPEQVKYAKESVEWLKSKACEICGTTSNLTVHHKARRGKLLNAKEYWMVVCVFCHDEIHQNETKAEKQGYIIRIRN